MVGILYIERVGPGHSFMRASNEVVAADRVGPSVCAELAFRPDASNCAFTSAGLNSLDSDVQRTAGAANGGGYSPCPHCVRIVISFQSNARQQGRTPRRKDSKTVIIARLC